MNPATPPAPNLDDDALQLEAQAWVIRLKTSSLTERQAREFRRWCGRSQAHATAFAQAREVWEALPQTREQWTQDFQMRQGRRHSPARRAFLGGVAACGALYLVARPPMQLWPSLADLRADYRTGAGEQRRVEVAEHVWLDMNTRTRLNLRDDPHLGRSVELLDGEIEVRQAGMSAAAFTVFAGTGTIQAFNGRTNIRYLDSEVCVTCLSGGALVDYSGQRQTLEAGQQVVYGRRSLSQPQAVPQQQAPSWRQGRLVFDNVPLSDVVRELNRYWAGRLILTDESLGGSRVTAQFTLDRLDEAPERIRNAYGVELTRLPGGIVLLGRKSADR
ncbi:FecR family protein [Alcaligenes sp. Marseille-Q7550]